MRITKKLLFAFAFTTSLMHLNRLSAQTKLPYYSGFDNAAETTGWQQFRLGTTASSLPYWVYTTSGPYSAPQCLTHSYPVGGTVPTDDWFVSPEFNFSAGATIDSIRRSFSGFGNPNNGDTVAIYLLNGNQDPAKATSIVRLFDYRGADYTNDRIWHKTAAIAIPATSGKSFIAIRYKTIVNWLDVKFDNIAISSKASSSIHTTSPATIQISSYPNPTRDLLYLSSPVPVKEHFVYDLSGRLLQRHAYTGTISMNHLPAGTYLLHSVLDNEEIICERIVKE